MGLQRPGHAVPAAGRARLHRRLQRLRRRPGRRRRRLQPRDAARRLPGALVRRHAADRRRVRLLAAGRTTLRARHHVSMSDHQRPLTSVQ